MRVHALTVIAFLVAAPATAQTFQLPSGVGLPELHVSPRLTEMLQSPIAPDQLGTVTRLIGLEAEFAGLYFDPETIRTLQRSPGSFGMLVTGADGEGKGPPKGDICTYAICTPKNMSAMAAGKPETAGENSDDDDYYRRAQEQAERQADEARDLELKRIEENRRATAEAWEALHRYESKEPSEQPGGMRLP